MVGLGSPWVWVGPGVGLGTGWHADDFDVPGDVKVHVEGEARDAEVPDEEDLCSKEAAPGLNDARLIVGFSGPAIAFARTAGRDSTGGAGPPLGCSDQPRGRCP